MRHDLVIAGGGPAGLAAAIAAAMRGMSTVVLERRHPPLDKPCGEGLMPPAVEALAQLGITLPSWGQHRFVGVRYLEGPLSAEGRFTVGHGLGVRRTALSAAMRERAEALGVELRFGTRLVRWELDRARDVRVTVRAHSAAAGSAAQQEQLTGRLLVASDGLHSQIRATAGLSGKAARQRRFGVRRHIAMPPWSEFVEVHWADGIEAYVTPVGPELVGIALLWSDGARKEQREHEGSDIFSRHLVAFPKLVARIQGHPFASSAKGAGPFRQRTRGCRAHGVVLIGDAAGYVDPLTGEGVSLALQSAQLLVDTLARGQPLASYERRYRQVYRRYALMAKLALTLARRPSLRKHAIALLGRWPGLFSRLLA